MIDPNTMKAKILIVDDYADEISILSEELQPDYQVFAATDGPQALERVAANRPDLILLDVVMPGMSGHDVCRRLKDDKDTRNIPVIFITSKGEEQDETEGFALGAVDYITKPFHLAVVRARVTTILKLKKEIDLREKLTVDLKELNERLEEKVKEQVAELRVAHDEAKASEEMLRVVMENILDLVFMTDDDGNFTFVCANVTHITGYSIDDLLSMGNVSELIRDLQVDIEELKREGGLYDMEKEIVDKSGRKRIYLINIRSVSIKESTQLWTCREITQRKELEDRLRQAYKMEAIGTLAGGIAHDFNNILSAIVGYTEISKDSVAEDSPLEQYLARVLEASSRAKDLVNQILMFSRETEQELKPVNISLPIKEALRLIRASVPTTIEMVQDIQNETAVLADTTQIHQLVMNLCTNAAHAMRDKGGTLTINLKDVEITSDQLPQYPDLSAGAYVKLSISDTGHGIPSHVIDRIFDPFFTTKEKGEGTGMGLSVVHGIIKNHGGAIYVASQVDAGTTFNIFLPSLERRSAKRKEQLKKLMPRGKETILFIDDEEMIVDIVRSMLENLGYKIFGKTAPIQALEMFQEEPAKFDLIVTDMTMPKMTGLDLAKRLRQLRPDIPILLCTGFGVDIAEATAANHGIEGIIFKPILMRDMVEKIRAVLDRKGKRSDS
jgi:PAS domain S-box-containing protein